MSNNYGKTDIQMIYDAKSILEAIHAYNHNCETCLKHGCNGEYCMATRALKNVSNRREFKSDMTNPEVRKQLSLALEMG